MKAQDILEAIAEMQWVLEKSHVQVPKDSQLMYTGFGLLTDLWGCARVALANPERSQEQIVVQWPRQVTMPWCYRPSGHTRIRCEFGEFHIGFGGVSPRRAAPWSDRLLDVAVVIDSIECPVDLHGAGHEELKINAGSYIEFGAGTWYQMRGSDDRWTVYHETYFAEAGEEPSGIADYFFRDSRVCRLGGKIEQDAPGATVTIDDYGFVHVEYPLLNPH